VEALKEENQKVESKIQQMEAQLDFFKGIHFHHFHHKLDIFKVFFLTVTNNFL
jgi:hypothetical protein